MSKLTFKKIKPYTGLMSVGYPHGVGTTVKHDKMQVGTIDAPNWHSKDGKWEVRLMKEQPDGGWAWVRVKTRFDDEKQARIYLKENSEKLLALNLHHAEIDDDE